MQRCQNWISPERVQRRMSTGSGDWSIRRSVDMWIEFGMRLEYRVSVKCWIVVDVEDVLGYASWK